MQAHGKKKKEGREGKGKMEGRRRDGERGRETDLQHAVQTAAFRTFLRVYANTSRAL